VNAALEFAAFGEQNLKHGTLQVTRAQAGSMNTKGLLRSKGGNALIEFALLAPVFLMLVMGLAEFVLFQYKSYAVNYVIHEATRRLQTGEVQNTPPPSGQTGRDVFKQKICAAAGALIDCEMIDCDVRRFPNIASIQYTTPIFNSSGRATNFQYLPGVQNEYTVVQGSYPHSFVTPFMATMFGAGDATRPAILSSFSIILGEPW
jgi:Flp pilus assembly protein TadG